jgi:hypothetical protein
MALAGNTAGCSHTVVPRKAATTYMLRGVRYQYHDATKKVLHAPELHRDRS